MATKINTNVLLLETDRKTRDTEREIIRAKAELEELQEKIAEKMSQLEKEMEECDGKVKVLKCPEKLCLMLCLAFCLQLI